MDLQPIPRPLECFGSEFKTDATMCNKCLHRTECMRAMGFRINRVPVSKTSFDLVPVVLQPSSTIQNPDTNVHTIFHACHDAVFGRPCKYNIPSGGREKIIAAAEQADCGLKLFITAVMIAHYEANPTDPFYPNMLFGQSAIKRVNMYRTYCREKFGHFDIGAFNKLRGHVDDTEAKMLNSEILFGQMIIGYRLKSDIQPFSYIYQLREIGFDPLWLAIEETYTDVLERHIRNEDPVTGHLATFRHTVFQIKKSLKSNKVRLVETLGIRQKIMPMAIQQVLYYHGLRDKDFEIENVPVVSVSHFWLVLGKAINSYYCWKAADGDKTALQKICKS